MRLRLFPALLAASLAVVLAAAAPAAADSFYGFGPLYGTSYYREFPERTRAARRARHGRLPRGCACVPADGAQPQPAAPPGSPVVAPAPPPPAPILVPAPGPH
jgi:hypothetical protein